MKNIYFVFLSILIMFYIIHNVRKNNLSIKISMVWMCACVIMLILSIFPYSLDWLAKLLGISYPPALFLTLCVIFLIVIDFNYSKKMSKLQEKITDLAQELSIVREKYEKR